MAQKKSTATTTNPKNPETPIRIVKENQTGKLNYQVGVDDRRSVYVRISENHGGGFFSDEWVAHADIQAAIEAWPEDSPVTGLTFRGVYISKSSNNAGFLIRILRELNLVEPMEGRKRCHQACDPGCSK
jgi:hypothetical protein